MADFSSDDLNRLNETLGNLNQSIVRLNGSKSFTSKSGIDIKDEKERGKLLKDWNKDAKEQKLHQKVLTKNLNDLKDVTSKLSKSFIELMTIGKLSDVIKDNISKYRDLSDAGQTFQGSMLNMNIAAADARLSLNKFSEMVVKNSTIIASIGTKSFFDLGKGLRDNLKQYGMLNMTTDQLNTYLSDYMETQRSYGLLNNLSMAQARDSMTRLAIETTKVSDLTGKSREELMKTSQKALQEDSLRSLMFQMQGKASKGFVDSMNKAVTYLAGMPGEAGDVMTSMLTQTVGKGSAMLGDQMQLFASTGMGGMIGAFDALAKKAKDGKVSDEDMDAFRKKFVEMGKANLTALQYQANYANSPEAKKMLRMIEEMSNLDTKKLKDVTENKKVTDFFMKFQEGISGVTSLLRKGFYEGLKKFLDGFGKIADSPGFQSFSARITEIGDKLGTWLGAQIQKIDWEKFGEKLATGADLVLGFATTLIDLVGKIGDALGWVIRSFTKLSDAVGTAKAAMLVLAGVIGTKVAVGAVRGKLQEKFDIGGGNGKGGFLPSNFHNGALKVWVVNQSVGKGGSGGNLDDLPELEKEEKGKIGKTGRFGRFFKNSRVGRLASRIGGTRLGRLAGKAGGFLGKGIGKVAKFGGLGGIVGGLALDAGMSYMNSKGSFKGKGALNVLGGAASGAMTGAMFGPIGAAIGGAVGGAISAYQHWDELSDDLSSAFGGVLDYSTKKLTQFSGFVTDVWKTGAAKASAIGESAGKLWDSAASAVSDVFSSFFDKLSGWFSNIFSWIGDLFKGNSLVAKIVGSTPIGAAVMSIMNANSAGPSNGATQAASVNTDILESQVKALQQQQKQILGENADLKKQLTQLMDYIAHVVGVQKAGMTELIDATKKGNRDLGVISGRTV